jgi:prepilin-type N-terminal cleavage/methylation domain-containing protein
MNGFTLLELTAVLALMAVASSAVVPAASRYRDRAEALAVRETLVALVQRTRTEALRAGGASLQIDGDARSARLSVGDSVVHLARLGAGGRVRVTPASGSLAVLGYNGLGLGIFASETIEVRVGAARARLVVSAYGRVRRD